ncbi:VanZ family protein [Bacillus alkalicellulosilyticus]|uniref:VanZ family protein n=1 Tax=Alkalihalobacterium alkalicellulosilyticum TaxID=1912214 RepID=UPI0009962F17|nr:VanZ family protein [Bacillus alkalicellulosilyticus]
MIVFFGTLILLIFIAFDFIRMRTNDLVRRCIFYSFLFYLIFVLHYTVGSHLSLPLNNEFFNWNYAFQLIPFYFVYDLYLLYNHIDSWFFWNAVKLSFLNVLLLLPFGVYLALLFNIKTVKKAAFILFLGSLTIESYQLLFGYIGLISGRTFNVDDLILNTIGGVVGFIAMIHTLKFYKKYSKEVAVSLSA